MTHRFILEPYKSIASRHTCPECKHKRYFSRYIDTEGAISFPEYVGRCDREQKCGYHLTPKTYFEQNPEQCEQTQARERPVSPYSTTIINKLYRRSFGKTVDESLQGK